MMIKHYNNKGTFKRSQISESHHSVLIHVLKLFPVLEDKDI